MRAPGHPQGCFITEMLMDELADRVKMDPVEFRIRNLPPQAPNAMWREYFKVGATLTIPVLLVTLAALAIRISMG